MAINLTKGQRIDLTKDNKGLDSIIVGLGWDRLESGGFIKRAIGIGTDLDIDASLVLLRDDHFQSRGDLVYYGNLSHSSGAVEHCGDNLVGGVGEGRGDDEQIKIKLNKIPNKYNRLVVVINVYNCVSRKQNFGMVKNAYARLINCNNKQEICRFNLTEDYGDKTGLIVGEIYRHQGEWKFSAIGEGTNDTSVGDMAHRYR